MQKKFARIILRIALVAVTIWFLCVVSVFALNAYQRDLLEKPNDIIDQLYRDLNLQGLTDSLKQKIAKSMAGKEKYYDFIAVYRLSDIKDYYNSNLPLNKAVYVYPYHPDPAKVYGIYSKGLSSYEADADGIKYLDENGKVLSEEEMKSRWVIQSGLNEEYFGFAERTLSDWIQWLIYLGIVSFMIYWVLFAIRAIIEAYHQKVLTPAWVIAFCLLNVFAYILFRSIMKKQAQMA